MAGMTNKCEHGEYILSCRKCDYGGILAALRRVGPLPEWSLWHKLLESASLSALRARPEPHAYAVVDAKMIDGSWRALELPIRFDETTISDENQIVEYRFRGLQSAMVTYKGVPFRFDRG